MRTRRAAATVAAVLAVALGTAGCDRGGHEAKAVDPPPTDACGMLTRARAETLLGGPVGEPRTDGSGRHGDVTVLTCSYVLAADPSLAVAVLLRREPHQNDDLAGAVRTMREATYAGAAVHEVASLGDRALWADAGGVRQVTVLAGDDVLVVSVAPATPVDAALALARDLLAARP